MLGPSEACAVPLKLTLPPKLLVNLASPHFLAPLITVTPAAIGAVASASVAPVPLHRLAALFNNPAQAIVTQLGLDAQQSAPVEDTCWGAVEGFVGEDVVLPQASR
eukprot:CAMPEP_0177575182 /NCGR_PEP_ID=MMETSP0369-20130122/79471_1 /TAXON_ID=447022 ORGANISM="Scrippsiella hangoei-like, Strain SHHI-4" /NCGR_SAMPLE_ID=MMETSP0369 /ASSEMBLY_ACC=CAM_ASM_000364 /LENGTH=105 /DNA_ID=CAMNT_0019063437 /DNA_START=355 /DNA_END=670 /DNA_ORIENTATION=-